MDYSVCSALVLIMPTVRFNCSRAVFFFFFSWREKKRKKKNSLNVSLHSDENGYMATYDSIFFCLRKQNIFLPSRL